MVRAAKEKRGLSWEEVFAEAKVEVAQPAKAASQLLTRDEGIKISLADWALRQTLLAGKPLDRAWTALSEAGLGEGHLANVQQTVQAFLSTSHETRETQKKEPVASGGLPVKIRPIVKNIKPVNRRGDYPLLSIKRGGQQDEKAVPSWMHLAAGPGGHLERSEDLWIIPKLSRSRGINLAVVRGNSMVETLQPGELIVLQDLNGGEGVRLPSLEPGQAKTPIDHFKRAVPNDEIFALSLDNGHSVTIKRVIYQVSKGGRWHMLIVADNPAEWESYVVQEHDEVIFYAKMIGYGKE